MYHQTAHVHTDTYLNLIYKWAVRGLIRSEDLTCFDKYQFECIQDLHHLNHSYFNSTLQNIHILRSEQEMPTPIKRCSLRELLHVAHDAFTLYTQGGSRGGGHGTMSSVDKVSPPLIVWTLTQPIW